MVKKLCLVLHASRDEQGMVILSQKLTEKGDGIKYIES